MPACFRLGKGAAEVLGTCCKATPGPRLRTSAGRPYHHRPRRAAFDQALRVRFRRPSPITAPVVIGALKCAHQSLHSSDGAVKVLACSDNLRTLEAKADAGGSIALRLALSP